jgi:hypothetical protein
MLALFPAIVVVVSVYGLVMDPEEIAAQVRTLGVLPDDVRSILTGQLDALVRAPSGRLSLSLAFGVLVALWSASAGMKALVTGVNIADPEAETRGFVRLRVRRIGHWLSWGSVAAHDRRAGAADGGAGRLCGRPRGRVVKRPRVTRPPLSAMAGASSEVGSRPGV